MIVSSEMGRENSFARKRREREKERKKEGKKRKEKEKRKGKEEITRLSSGGAVSPREE